MTSSTPHRARRQPAFAMAALALAMVTAALPAADASPRPDTPSLEALTAPEGGQVDDGWLPGPDGAGAFLQFTDEPAPAGGPVWPGVYREARRTTLSNGGGVDIQILHLGPDADVQIRPTLAGGSVRGVAPVTAQSGNPLAGAVAAINGGFWLREPYGEPNGFFAIDGRLVSDSETQGAGPRGTVGWTADGQVVVDRVDSVQTLQLADGTTVDVDGINRGHREYDELFADGRDSALAYTPDYGGPVSVTEPQRPPLPDPDPSAPPTIPGEEPPAEPPIDLAVLRIAAPHWPAAGSLAGTVIGISRDGAGSFTANPGEVIIAATGDPAGALDGVLVGDTVALATRLTALDPARDGVWATVDRGLAGGPMIVKDSRMTDPGDWVNEGFEPQIHSDVRAPRTAIGVTADGRTLMVTADGRRPGITQGFTIGELGAYMISLGAVEAVSLDGGGSSQMVVDGVLRNTPCCDSSIRAVADSLQVVHDYSFSTTRRIQGAGRVDTAAAIAREAFGATGARRSLLAVASSFPDALAGGPLASAADAPVLLTGTDFVPAVTLQVMADLGVTAVTLLGGQGAISTAVEDELVGEGFAVSRVAGETRVETAVAMADAAESAGLGSGDAPRRAFVVPAGTFADAMIAAAPGGMLGMPILLTGTDVLHPATRDRVAGYDEVVVVDAEHQLSGTVLSGLGDVVPTVTRFGGDGRYATGAAIADWLAEQVPLADGVIVARGDTFPDALAGGPLAARLGTPLVLVPPGSIDADPGTSAWFARQSDAERIRQSTILGGLAAVSSYHQWQLDQIGLG